MTFKEDTKIVIEKIEEILKLIYNKVNFFVATLLFLVLTLISFIVTEYIILKGFLDNNYLIVNTVNRLITNRLLIALPYTQSQEVDLMNIISWNVQPYIFMYYYYGIITFLCLMIGIYKLIKNRRK